ncbi:exopolysaccharide biosynthesis protein [Govanella unica]|uniref:Exopolysaccharide biosynthesis protein n=1 Tax=Govanella unica TaxID=2975056 RepID=A0A9X3Z8P5_9PROT|nr:exopolysaccharide biosynthesis protein [Govania unica]MDA5195123.1 exopolysaccharide biosynthesis protein [Govania unica]
MKPPHSARDKRSISVALRDFIDGWEGERVSLNDLRLALADRAYGALMVFFAAPNLIPVSIPGMSAVLGIPLMLLSVQLMIGQPHPWFPKFLGRRSFATRDFKLVLDRVLPILAHLERVLRPRVSWLTAWGGERFLGFACLILATVLSLPIPFGNFLPALAILLMALALIEKDGLAYLIGLAVGIASLVIASGVVIGLATAAFFAIEKLLS